MFKQYPIKTTTRARVIAQATSLVLFVLMALSTSAFAQTQSTSDLSAGVTEMVATAKSDPAVAVPANAPKASAEATAAAPSGAGSDHNGYVTVRGYFFSINRSGANRQ